MDARRILLLAALLALAAGPPASTTPLPDPDDRWIRVETPSLTLFSNAPQGDAYAIASSLETFRFALSRIGGSLDTRSPVPTYIYLFKNDESYGFFKPRRKTPGGEAPDNVSGYLVKHRDGNYIAADATPREDPWAVIYHEYFHLYLLNNFTDIPVWLGEGLAECYSTFRFKNGVAYLGAPVYPHLHWLEQVPLLPLQEILAVTADSPDYHEGERQGTFYAESWALAHYLLWGPGGTGGGATEFLGRARRGGSLREAVNPLLAGDLEALRERLRIYVRTWRFTETDLKPGNLATENEWRVREMGREEVLFRLGDYLIHLDPGRAADAEEYFRGALRASPEYGPAYYGLAQVLAHARRFDEANASFEKALALNPSNQAVSLAYAHSLIDQTFPPGVQRRPPGETPPALKRARELFQRSTRLDPGAAGAWEGLGMTYLFDTGDPAPGIAALEKARQLLPGSVEIAFNLASLCARSGDAARARDLIDHVVSRSDDPEKRAAGADLLVRTEVAEALALISKGSLQAGLERLRLLREKAPTPELRGEIDSLLARAAQGAERRRLVGIYNEAVERAGRSDFAGAAALLRQVAGQSTDPDLALQAREALAKVRAAEVSARHFAWYRQAGEKLRDGKYQEAAVLLRKILGESKDERMLRAAGDLLERIRADYPDVP